MPVTAVSLSWLPVISSSSFHHLAPPTPTVYRVSDVGVTDNVWELGFILFIEAKKEKRQGWIFLDTFLGVQTCSVERELCFL